MSNGLRERQTRDIDLTEFWLPEGAATHVGAVSMSRARPLTPLLTLFPTPSTTCRPIEALSASASPQPSALPSTLHRGAVAH